MDDSSLRVLESQEIVNTQLRQQETMLVSMLKPKFGVDGNQYYYLYGDNLQEGIAGFGDSAYHAMLDFNRNFYKRNLNNGR